MLLLLMLLSLLLFLPLSCCALKDSRRVLFLLYHRCCYKVFMVVGCFFFFFLQHIYSSIFPTNIIYMLVYWHCTRGTIVMWSDYERTLNKIASWHFSVVKVWSTIFRKNVLIILSVKTAFLVNTFKGTSNIGCIT